MKCIVVADKNWGIGKDNRLLVHLPGDLKYFKEKTLGKVLIMGRRTVDSLPGGRPLPGRTTIILTRQKDYTEPSGSSSDGSRIFVCRSKAELGDLLSRLREAEGIDPREDVFVAGGESIYEMFFEDCDEFLVTKIDETFEADKRFPNLDALPHEARLTWESEPVTERGVTYRFTKYEKI